VKILLDTNVYFAAIHDARFVERHRETLLAIGPRLFLSSVVRAELLQGAKGDLGRARVTRATRQIERAGRVVAPSHEEWVRAGTVQGRIWDKHASLRNKKMLHDILIVCTARRVGAVIVTDNTADFNTVRAYLPHRAVAMDELPALLGKG
jgi:predicted nucleic acid-binding protein